MVLENYVETTGRDVGIRDESTILNQICHFEFKIILHLSMCCTRIYYIV